MRVLLINPDSTEKIEVAIHKRLLTKDFVYPPLGLLYLSARVRSAVPNCQLNLLDLQTEKSPHDVLKARLAQLKPDVVGISVFTNLLPSALAIARIVKKEIPHCLLVVGGPHVTLYAREMLGFADIDCAIPGEAEDTFAELLRCCASGKQWQGEIPGIVTRQDLPTIDLPKPSVVDDLDSLPQPDRCDLPVRRYSMLTGRRSHSTVALTSRGCPFRCTFCDVTHSKVRFHSVDWVLKDLEGIASSGLREVHFFDDIFNLDPDRVTAIAQGITDRDLRLEWSFRGRVDRMNSLMLRKARQAGCYRTYLGLESGSPKTLHAMRKGITVEDIRSGVDAARREGLEVHGYFMIGFPGETVEDMMATLELALELDLDFAQFSVTSYLPGSPIYERAVETGEIQDVWRDFATCPDAAFTVPLPAERTIGETEIWNMSRSFYRRFYLRPGIALKALRSVRSPTAFLRRAKGALLSISLR